MSEGRPAASGPALGRLEDFPDLSATPVKYRAGEREVALLVVRRGVELRAYLDVCPHVFLPLTQRGRRVLSADGERLRARTMVRSSRSRTAGRCAGRPPGAA